MSVGSYTDTRDATIEVQQITEQVRFALESKMKQRFIMYDSLLYRSQLVDGTNYIVKVHIEYEKHGYVHVKLFNPLPVVIHDFLKPASLVGYQANKTLEDPIEIF